MSLTPEQMREKLHAVLDDAQGMDESDVLCEFVMCVGDILLDMGGCPHCFGEEVLDYMQFAIEETNKDEIVQCERIVHGT